jgi:hypothetical protein
MRDPNWNALQQVAYRLLDDEFGKTRLVAPAAGSSVRSGRADVYDGEAGGPTVRRQGRGRPVAR